MGWLFNPSWQNKADVIAHVTEEYHTFKTLRSCVRGNILWALHWLRRTSGEEIQFITCYLLKKTNGHWGYKDMDETVGPFYYSCPLSYLDAAGDPSNELSARWRKKVRTYHAQRRSA